MLRNLKASTFGLARLGLRLGLGTAFIRPHQIDKHYFFQRTSFHLGFGTLYKLPAPPSTPRVSSSLNITALITRHSPHGRGTIRRMRGRDSSSTFRRQITGSDLLARAWSISVRAYRLCTSRVGISGASGHRLGGAGWLRVGWNCSSALRNEIAPAIHHPTLIDVIDA